MADVLTADAIIFIRYLATTCPNVTSSECARLLDSHAELRARLESAEAKCQLSSMDGTLTTCACCGARGIPSRGSKPEHAADCPFALGAAGEERADG